MKANIRKNLKLLILIKGFTHICVQLTWFDRVNRMLPGHL